MPNSRDVNTWTQRECVDYLNDEKDCVFTVKFNFKKPTEDCYALKVEVEECYDTFGDWRIGPTLEDWRRAAQFLQTYL